MHRSLLVAVLTLAACHTTRSPVAPSRAGSAALTVVTDRGPVVGSTRDGMRTFLGIPFAAPPLGALRFRAPAEVAAWTAPRDATHAGPACPQLDDSDYVRPQSEDCLTLNVWAPAGEKLPVMVWIHGGAFYQGSGNDDQYDGARLAAREHVVVVSFNYRVGPLGFLSHRALAREAGRATSPSPGILDQRAALAWVQRNIARVGGDATRVTIFGESAGAWSTCTQLASPGSRGLFSRAIMQSGGCSNALYFGPREAEAQGEALAHKLGCRGDDALACLRAKSSKEIVEALPMKRGLLLTPGVWWGPVVDGVELPRQPLDLMRAGQWAKVPLLIGANHEEGTLHVISFKSVTAPEVEGFVRYVFGDEAVQPVLARYARATPKQSLSDLVGDGIFVCHARRVARAASPNTPVYLYHFTHPLDDPRVHGLGATHSVELFFVFGNPSQGFALSPNEVALSHTIMDAWGAFARSGDPSTSALPWPRYDAATDEHLTLDTQSARGAHLQRETCDFWDALDHRPRANGG